jgi:hypothetical protein
MHSHDHPTIGRRSCYMEHLALGQAAVGRVNRCGRRSVLRFGATSELMHDAIAIWVSFT